MSAFPTGKPREEDHIETVVCKTCKRPVLKPAAIEHIRGCLKAKQEKTRKKKEARDAANRAKEKVDGDDDGDSKLDGEDSMKGQKSAKKSSAVKGMADDGTKKGKKRKADGSGGTGPGGAGGEDDKEPKKKKKKEEPKPKTAKPKGPVDVEKQCGVTLPNGAQCARSLTCKSHSMGAKRGVPGRSLPYDMLLQAYQKKNQARQQSTCFFIVVCCDGDGDYGANKLQRRPSTPMLRCKRTWKTMAPWTRTKRKTASWLLSAVPTPNPWPPIPSSRPRTSIAMSGSRRCCRMHWEVHVVEGSFPPATIPLQMEEAYSKPRTFPTTPVILTIAPQSTWSINPRHRRRLGRNRPWLRASGHPGFF